MAQRMIGTQGTFEYLFVLSRMNLEKTDLLCRRIQGMVLENHLRLRGLIVFLDFYVVVSAVDR